MSRVAIMAEQQKPKPKKKKATPEINNNLKKTLSETKKKDVINKIKSQEKFNEKGKKKANLEEFNKEKKDKGENRGQHKGQKVVNNSKKIIKEKEIKKTKKITEKNTEKKIQKNITKTTFQPFPLKETIKNKNKKNKEKDKIIAKESNQKIEKSISNKEKQEFIDKTQIYPQALALDPLKEIEEEYKKLSPLKKEILDIAKSILKKKKYSATLELDRIELMSPLMSQLFEKSVAKLTHTKGYSKEQIFEALKELEQDFWLVSNQRRTKYEILESEAMKRVLLFIRNHPGCHARESAITEELGITRNPFLKHMMVLEAFGLIRSKKIGKRLNFFLADIPEIFDDLVVLFQNPLVVDIVNLILENPNIGLSELAKRLNVYHGAIQYHLKILRKLGILLPAENINKENENTNIKKNSKNLGIINKPLLLRYNQLFKVPPFNTIINKD